MLKKKVDINKGSKTTLNIIESEGVVSISVDHRFKDYYAPGVRSRKLRIKRFKV